MKGFWNVKVICAVISGVALIVAACIGVADRYLLEGEDSAKEDDRPVPVPLLEKELSDANIYLSDTETNKVRGFLRHDLAYQALARDCLALLKGKQLVSPVPLDNINGFYEKMMGPLKEANQESALSAIELFISSLGWEEYTNFSTGQNSKIIEEYRSYVGLHLNRYLQEFELTDEFPHGADA